MKYELRKFNGPRDWGFIKENIPLLRVEDTCGFLAMDADTETHLGAIIFDNFTYNTVQAHIIIKNPMILRHGFIQAGTQFAFELAGLNIIYGVVAEFNHKALKLNKHLGFKEVYRIPQGHGPGQDYIVMALERPLDAMEIEMGLVA